MASAGPEMEAPGQGNPEPTPGQQLRKGDFKALLPPSPSCPTLRLAGLVTREFIL